MFYLLAIIAPAAYALQNTLMSSFYRRIDRLSAITYRGLSLGISMSPVLLLVPPDDPMRVDRYLLPLLLASLFAVFGNWASATCYYYLPVGIGNALCFTFSSIVASVLSFSVLGERISIVQLALIVILIIQVLSLGRLRAANIELQSYNVPRGMLAAALFGVCLGSAYMLVASLSRNLNPLLVGYLWETLIGVFGLAIIAVRARFGNARLERIDRRTFGRLLCYSAPTAIGTACFATAIAYGPLSLAAALLGLAMVFSSMFAYAFYRERLSPAQIGIIVLICITVAALKLAE